MRYCSYCGRQIPDDAVFCTYCGKRTGFAQQQQQQQQASGYTQQQYQSSGYAQYSAQNSVEHQRFQSVINDVNAIFVFGILSIALCLGIGLIFQIINMCKLSKYNNKVQKGYTLPEFRLTNPNDIQAYENAKKKIKTASTLTGLGFGISAALIFLAIWFGLVMPAVL